MDRPRSRSSLRIFMLAFSTLLTTMVVLWSPAQSSARFLHWGTFMADGGSLLLNDPAAPVTAGEPVILLAGETIDTPEFWLPGTTPSKVRVAVMVSTSRCVDRAWPGAPEQLPALGLKVDGVPVDARATAGVATGDGWLALVVDASSRSYAFETEALRPDAPHRISLSLAPSVQACAQWIAIESVKVGVHTTTEAEALSPLAGRVALTSPDTIELSAGSSAAAVISPVAHSRDGDHFVARVRSDCNLARGAVTALVDGTRTPLSFKPEVRARAATGWLLAYAPMPVYWHRERGTHLIGVANSGSCAVTVDDVVVRRFV